MLDPSIITDLQKAIAPPSPPVIERPWFATAADTADKRGRLLLDKYAVYAAEWKAELDRMRERIASLLPVETASPGEIDEFTETIADVEDMAETRAVQLRRVDKDIARRERGLAGDPSLKEVYRQGARRLRETEQSVIEALLEFALFLRSLRADAAPDAKGGPVFNSPTTLQKHLRSLLA